MPDADENITINKPTLGSRLAALVVGSAYLGILSFGLSRLYEIPFVVALCCGVMGAGTIFAVVAIFCVKLVTREGSARRLKLSTLFLPFIPVAVYLAILSQIVHRIQTEVPNPRPRELLPLVAIFIFFAIVTTAMLLWFGEAVVWLLIRAYAKWKPAGKRNSDLQPPA